MTWGMVAVAAGTVVAGAIGADSSRRAVHAQQDAARAATEAQRQQTDQLREDQTPYREGGYQALADLLGLRGYDPTPTPESVMNEPGYEFGRAQGMRGIESSAAARGMGLSGAALRNASRFNTDYAGTKYGEAWGRAQSGFQNRWNRLAALAGIGQTATQQTGQAGMAFGQMAGNNMIGAGNAQAAGQITRGNIYADSLNNLASQYGRYSRAQNQNPYGDRSGFRGNDPYRDPLYYGGAEGE